ncbi:RNA chaperone Hfq [bacterium]|nr:RNA chaperone Hfq [bacterium]
MSESTFNLQDKVLNQARIKQYPIKINLLNKSIITGKVEGFDKFTLIMNKNGEQELIFKHAISSISPVSPIKTLLPKHTQSKNAKEDTIKEDE